MAFKALDLQLMDDKYRARAGATARDKLTVYPSRGVIYDRNQQLLTYNEPVFDLMVTYNQVDKSMDTLKFCELLGITKTEFAERLEKDFRGNRQFSRRKPFVFLSKISAETNARFQESLYQFPGFFVQTRNVRGYPHRNAAHVLGYIREVNREEVSSSNGVYRSGDYIGASGLELAYENELKGTKGAKYVLKDNLGRIVGPYEGGNLDTLPQSGSDLITGLDIALQSYGEELMQNKTGSIVAIEPATGEILAMISMPTYDPNLLTINRNRGKAYRELLSDPLLPFFDRCIMAEYPPGSIFKTVVGLAAMQEGVISPDQGFSCNGGYNYNGRLYKCHFHSYPGNIEVALQHSCNAYFWQTFRKIIDKEGFYEPEKGLDIFDQYCYAFGIGRQLGIDYPREKSGNVPTPAYYDRVFKKKGAWKSPTIMSLGIGQGEMQMTTMQIANLAAILANRGYYFTPHLVKGFSTDTTQIDGKYRVRNTVPVDAYYFDRTIAGMRRVVEVGTGVQANVPGTTVCGKTGTVENPHGADHSAFFAFAPQENPKIAIAVFIENSGWGGQFAAPVAGLMIEKYLNREIAENRKYLEERIKQTNLVAERLARLTVAEEEATGEE